MTDRDPAEVHERPTSARTPEHAFVRILAGAPEQLAGTLYGTIVVLAIIAAGSTSRTAHPWQIVDLVVSGTLVLWLAHVYAHGVAESVQEGHRLTSPELRGIARREAAIIVAGIAPVAALTLGALNVLDEDSAIWLAIGLCVLTLGLEGLRYARLERLSGAATLATVAMNMLIGLLIVALKLELRH